MSISDPEIQGKGESMTELKEGSYMVFVATGENRCATEDEYGAHEDNVYCAHSDEMLVAWDILARHDFADGAEFWEWAENNICGARIPDYGHPAYDRDLFEMTKAVLTGGLANPNKEDPTLKGFIRDSIEVAHAAIKELQGDEAAPREFKVGQKVKILEGSLQGKVACIERVADKEPRYLIRTGAIDDYFYTHQLYPSDLTHLPTPEASEVNKQLLEALETIRKTCIEATNAGLGEETAVREIKALARTAIEAAKEVKGE